MRPPVGASTTGLAALQLRRRFAGIDISAAFHDEAHQRILRHMHHLGMSVDDESAEQEDHLIDGHD